jgi:hypothetical protein
MERAAGGSYSMYDLLWNASICGIPKADRDAPRQGFVCSRVGRKLQISVLDTRRYPAGAGSISQRNDPDSRSVVETVILRWVGL